MKKIFLSLVILTMVTASCTKENIARVEDAISGAGGSSDDHGGGSGKGTRISETEVPDLVINAFEEMYTEAANVEWKRLDNGNYKVQFFAEDVKIETTFTAEGKLVKEERE